MCPLIVNRFTNMLFSVLLAIAGVWVLQKVFCPQKRPNRFPPGPPSWPLLGNLFHIGLEPYKRAMEMRKKYGDIIGLRLGTRRAVFLNEYKILKEAYSLPAFSGRCLMEHFAEPETGIFHGIVFTSGQTWLEQRRFAFSYIQSELRNEKIMEDIVMTEVAEVIEYLTKRSGTPLNTRLIFNISAVNTLWCIIAGRRYSLNDPTFKKLIEHSTEILSLKISQGILVFYPRLSKILRMHSSFQKLQKSLQPISDFVRTIIDEHKRTYEKSVQRDFVDSYLHKIATTTDRSSSFYGPAGEMNLVHSILDIFISGTDTISSTLHWLIFLMAQFSQVQNKLIAAISLQLDQNRPVTIKDRISLSYVEAVIQEVMRFSSLTPLGLFHETLEDVEFHSYKIPKGTMVVANQYGIMHDPGVWGDPENFRPERFLADNENEIIHHPAMVAFGAGRRSCPGESFARDELFLFVTSLFQKHTVEFNPSTPIPSLKYIKGFSMLPVDHQIIFRRI